MYPTIPTSSLVPGRLKVEDWSPELREELMRSTVGICQMEVTSGQPKDTAAVGRIQCWHHCQIVVLIRSASDPESILYH